MEIIFWLFVGAAIVWTVGLLISYLRYAGETIKVTSVYGMYLHFVGSCGFNIVVHQFQVAKTFGGWQLTFQNMECDTNIEILLHSVFGHDSLAGRGGSPHLEIISGQNVYLLPAPILKDIVWQGDRVQRCVFTSHHPLEILPNYQMAE